MILEHKACVVSRAALEAFRDGIVESSPDISLAKVLWADVLGKLRRGNCLSEQELQDLLKVKLAVSQKGIEEYRALV